MLVNDACALFPFIKNGLSVLQSSTILETNIIPLSWDIIAHGPNCQLSQTLTDGQLRVTDFIYTVNYVLLSDDCKVL